MMRNFVLAAAIALAACGPKTPANVQIDPSLSTLVPANTVFMAGTRLESLMKAPVYQKYIAGRDFPQIKDFAARTGIDPRKDLWELLFVSDGRGGVLLGRGKFADEMMEPDVAHGAGGKRFGYKGYKLIGDERAAVMFINSTTAAVSDVASLQALADHRGESSGPPPGLAPLIKEIPAGAQFWAAFTGSAITLPFDESSNLGNLNRMVRSVQSGTLYFDLSGGVKGLADVTCTSDQDAEQVYGALKALVGLGRLSVPKDQPQLAQVYDTIRVTQESRRVRLHMDVPEAMVEQFLGMWLGKR
jgi:hypothetical protein